MCLLIVGVVGGGGHWGLMKQECFGAFVGRNGGVHGD